MHLYKYLFLWIKINGFSLCTICYHVWKYKLNIIKAHVLEIFHFLLTDVNTPVCQYRGNKTDTGFINLCTSCLTMTDLGSEKFPRYINEIVCNVEPCLTINTNRKYKYYYKNMNLLVHSHFPWNWYDIKM